MSGLEGLLSGRLLGDRYRIAEVIGRGGMGAVYRAVDERLGREVAVKVITATTGNDPEARARLRARFNREARAAAALPHHPNVVPVYDYGSDATLELDYLVMELLRGHDLSTRLARSGPPPLADALKILYESARGLAVGHRAGLIHRDVKPGNIFLAEADHEEIQVRVVDFGIAKLADDDDSQLTQDGRVPHSPAFASPEQLRGLGKLTPAADVFGLGAVGFVLLTGERPFSDDDRNRMSLGMPIPPPALRDHNRAIPASVEAIIQKALAFEPGDRFPDAAAMAGALGEALRAIPDTPLEPYNAGPIGSIIPVGAAPYRPADADDTRLLEDDRTLLAPEPAAGAAPILPLPPVPPPEQSRAAVRAARRKRGIGGILVWTLVLLLLGAAGVWAWMESRGRTVEVAQAPTPVDSVPADTAVPAVEEDEEEEPPAPSTELDAAIQNQEGIRFYQAQQYTDALPFFRTAVEVSPDNAQYRRNLALTLMQVGQASEAATQLQRTIDLDPSLAIAHANLAEARLILADTIGAIASLERFLAAATDPRMRALAERRLRDLVALTGVRPLTVDTMQQVFPDTAGSPPDTADPGA